jgi:cell division protein FtsB
MTWSRHPEARTESEPTGEVRSDARPAADHPRYAELDPDADRHSRVRRRLFQLCLVTLFVLGSGASLFGERGWLDRVRLHRQYRTLDREVTAQRERVEALREEVAGLRANPLSRERIAREQLGYVRPGEVLFLLPEEEDARTDDEAGPRAEP